MGWLGRVSAWFASEYIKDYRENRTRTYELIIKNSLHLNTIILTVSVASLTAMAALNDKVFVDHPWPSAIVIGLFILVILFSTINFFLSGLVLSDLQQRLNKDILFPFKASKYRLKYRLAQKMLNVTVLGGFCFGLISLLALLILYISGAAK